MDEIDSPKVENASKHFSKVVDATSNFLKEMFPYGYTLVEKLKRANKEKKEAKDDVQIGV